MSDGPHRSLPLRKLWKELAKRGDQSVYSIAEVAEAAKGALAYDLKEVKWELMDALKAVFTGRDNSLRMREISLQELEDAKTIAASSVFGLNAVQCAVLLINEGRFGVDAFYEAIGLAAKIRGFANIRSIEEHYLRHSNQQRASKVCKRLSSVISSFSDTQLGSLLVSDDAAKTTRIKKRSQIDEGVPL